MLTLFSIFEKNVSSYGAKPAFISLESSNERVISYSDLWEMVCAKSSRIVNKAENSSAILIYESTIDFLTSFLACQRVGMIAIPMFYPRNNRHIDRLIDVLNSAQTKIVYTESKDVDRIREGIHKLNSTISVGTLDGEKLPENHSFSEGKISFIQYTSGSTSAPKGVVVSQSNLTHNQQMLSEIFQCDENSTILSWLPFYHDMGLIGSLLHTLYVGCTCVLLKPSTVVSSPTKWFEAIQKHNVTHTGGPNFIYDLCNRLSDDQLAQTDLSSVKVMYNGSEPIKAKTVQDFIERFAPFGFMKSAYRVCYGLAEATLVVSGGEPVFSGDQIGSGKLASEMNLVFFNNETLEVDLIQGEICLHGPSITEGYWQIDSSSYCITYNGKSYVKTGDIGSLRDGVLFVEGRLKEMLIINGQNIFPYDLEIAIAQLDEAFMENGVSVSEENGELYVFAELERSFLTESQQKYVELRLFINKELIDSIGIESTAIVFVMTRSLPRTSSGKLQRKAMVSLWREGALKEVGDKEFSEIQDTPFDLESFQWSQAAVQDYLVRLIQEKLRIKDPATITQSTLFELGLSSIKAVELVNRINEDLDVKLSLESVFELNDVQKVTNYILDLKWLKSEVTDDKEIEL